MNPKSLDKTLPISEQIVGDAWRDFTASSPPLSSVPAFLSWLGHHQPEVLKLINEERLIMTASRLLGEQEEAPPPFSDR